MHMTTMGSRWSCWWVADGCAAAAAACVARSPAALPAYLPGASAIVIPPHPCRAHPSPLQRDTSWGSYVAQTWRPVLDQALGPDWQSRHGSDVAAMIALHRSLQPRAGGSNSVSPSSAAQACAPETKKLESSVQVALPPSAPAASPAPAPCPAARHLAGGSAVVVMEAPVDADGKRRRLRRKRAASPDSAESPTAAHTAAAESAAAAGAAAAGGAAAAAAPQAAKDAGAAVNSWADQAAQVRRAAAEEAMLQVLGGGGRGAATQGTQAAAEATAAAAAGQAATGSTPPLLLQRVTRQVSKLAISQALSIGRGGSSSNLSAAPQPAASVAAAGSSEAAAPREAGVADTTVVVGAAGHRAAHSDASLADGLLQQHSGLLSSLSLVTEISQRIVSSLQLGTTAVSTAAVAASAATAVVQGALSATSEPPRLEQQPQQGGAPEVAAAALAAVAAAEVQGDGSAAAGGAIPSLSLLLGGSLLDRKDIMGRTGVCLCVCVWGGPGRSFGLSWMRRRCFLVSLLMLLDCRRCLDPACSAACGGCHRAGSGGCAAGGCRGQC